MIMRTKVKTSMEKFIKNNNNNYIKQSMSVDKMIIRIKIIFDNKINNKKD